MPLCISRCTVYFTVHFTMHNHGSAIPRLLYLFSDKRFTDSVICFLNFADIWKKLSTMQQGKCMTIFWGFVNLYTCCCHLFALATDCGFQRISGYRPSLLSEESSGRSLLECALFCSMDSKCAGFAFMWMRGMCIGYGMEEVKFTPEAGIEFYIKGKSLN